MAKTGAQHGRTMRRRRRRRGRTGGRCCCERRRRGLGLDGAWAILGAGRAIAALGPGVGWRQLLGGRRGLLMLVLVLYVHVRRTAQAYGYRQGCFSCCCSSGGGESKVSEMVRYGYAALQQVVPYSLLGVCTTVSRYSYLHTTGYNKGRSAY